jgi:uncharacterized protein (TIGR03382 family)
VFRLAAQGQDAADAGPPPASSGPPASVKTGCSSAPGNVDVAAALALAFIVAVRLRRPRT